MSSASKNLLLFILILFQTSIASNSKLLKNDASQFLGGFLQPDSAQKMKETTKQWSDVKIYENIFRNGSKVTVLRNVNTQKIMWETVQFNKLWIPFLKQNKLEWYLRQNDDAKWNDVFLWFSANIGHGNNSQTDAFLKALLLAIAENVPVKFTADYGTTPLMLAAEFDDTNSILSLIKRGANVNRQNESGWTPLHFAAFNGNVNACETLLENNANIDAIDHNKWTPLMGAAMTGRKNMFDFLIEKGANKNLTNNFGKTASQLARFQKI